MIDRLLATASFSPDFFEEHSAWRGHLPFADWLIRELSPKLFVELGTHFGHSYFSFCQSIAINQTTTQCYAVDTWQGDEHAGSYEDAVFLGVQAYNQDRFKGFSQLMRMTFDDAAAYFSDASIDLLHIDGLHTYEAVRHDFETWLPKLAPGAVVLFHDTCVRERGFGVWRLWEELQALYPNNLEFSHSHGLGVLQLNNAPHEKRLAWLDPSDPERANLTRYFSSLGERQSERFELLSLKKTLAELGEQVEHLKLSIVERDGQIAEIFNTTSWRITRPVRWIGRQVKRVRRAF